MLLQYILLTGVKKLSQRFEKIKINKIWHMLMIELVVSKFWGFCHPMDSFNGLPFRFSLFVVSVHENAYSRLVESRPT